MFCVDWGDKRKIETLAVDDTKKRVSEMFRGLEKRWCQWIISEGGYFEGDKIDIDKIEKNENNGYFLIRSCKPQTDFYSLQFLEYIGSFFLENA